METETCQPQAGLQKTQPARPYLPLQIHLEPQGQGDGGGHGLHHQLGLDVQGQLLQSNLWPMSTLPPREIIVGDATTLGDPQQS